VCLFHFLFVCLCLFVDLSQLISLGFFSFAALLILLCELFNTALYSA
jgi:diacylglycerol kinase